MNVRALAAKTLAPVLQQKVSLQSTFDSAINSLDISERALFQELCFGVLRRFYELEKIAKQLLKKPLRNKDSDVFALLLVGLYQLRHMRLPDHAVISQTVAASKGLKKNWSKNVLNACLRSAQRDAEKLETKLSGDLAARYSHPLWLIEKLRTSWPEHWREILEANNQRAPLSLRVNLSRCSKNDYLKMLEQESIAAETLADCEAGIRLLESHDVTSLPGFNEGLFSVQDEAAQFAAQLLDAQAGNRVLDACCAPGGKTAHILERQTQLSELVAVELEENRMQRVKENFARLKLQATLKVGDASQPDSWWDSIQFDRILLDAPCSATGVIRRHPDIKLLRRESDLAKLAELQLLLLTRLWPCLKPGGRLVYATCSVLPDENNKNIERFVQQTHDAHHQALKASWGEQQEFGRQLFPKAAGHDGFYYAVLTKQ